MFDPQMLMSMFGNMSGMGNLGNLGNMANLGNMFNSNGGNGEQDGNQGNPMMNMFGNPAITKPKVTRRIIIFISSYTFCRFDNFVKFRIDIAICWDFVYVCIFA